MSIAPGRFAVPALLAALWLSALPLRGQTPSVPLDPAGAPDPQVEALAECEIVAQINGQVIQACEVIWQVNQILQDNGDRIPPGEVDNVRRMLMQRQIAGMVDTKLIYGEFARTVPPENQQNVDQKLRQPFQEREIPRLMKALDVQSVAQLEQRLHDLGSSLEDMRRTFRERVVAGEWIRSNIKYNKEVTHDEMLAWYQQHADQYAYPTQVRWEELMVRKNHFNHPRQAYEAIANMGNQAYTQAVARQLRGPIFGDVARAHSQGFTASEGGLHPWTTQGALKARAVDDALFSLQVGQLSPVLESDLGFHIVRVLERKEAGRTPFTDVQNEIRDKLKEQRFNAAVEVYLADLRRNARIWTVYTGNVSYEQLAQPPAAAPARR